MLSKPENPGYHFPMDIIWRRDDRSSELVWRGDDRSLEIVLAGR